MSFGFSVGDFLAVGKLSLHLWRSFKNAPGEFAAVSRELSSVNIVITDLTDQAGSTTSLLNRRGASRKSELIDLRNNLMSTLEELQEVNQKYHNMGMNAWRRVQLGEQDLAGLRSKLSLHLGLIDKFMSSLTMASVGRMEPMVGRMEPMLMEALQYLRFLAAGGPEGRPTLLPGSHAHELVDTDDAGVEERWRAVRAQLQSNGIPESFIQSHEDDIRTLGQSQTITFHSTPSIDSKLIGA